MYEAIYGDGNGNIGMHKMVEEMYKFYAGATFGGKFIRNTVTLFTSLCAAIFVIWADHSRPQSVLAHVLPRFFSGAFGFFTSRSNSDL